MTDPTPRPEPRPDRKHTMTDDTLQDADSAALEAARSGLFDAPDDAATDPDPESQDPLAGNSPPTSHSADDDYRAFARELFGSGN